MRHARFRLSFLLALCLAFLQAHAALADQKSEPAAATGRFEADILKIGPGNATLTLRLPLGDKLLKIPLDSEQNKLSGVRAGDKATVVVDSVEQPTAVLSLVEVTRSASVYARTLALGGSLAAILGAAAVAARWNPRRFLIGMDNRYSNSQVQLAFWFAAVAMAYAAAVVLRWHWAGGFIGGVSIPNNLIGLTGLSALSFGGAKIITTQKVAAAKDNADTKAAAAAEAQAVADANAATSRNAAATESVKPDDKDAKAAAAIAAANAASAKAKSDAAAKAAADAATTNVKTRGTPNFLKDLVQNDHDQPDLGDFQMILIAFASVLIFALKVYSFLGAMPVAAEVSLPDVDTTLLASFGVGQGAYLVKKAALNVGDG
jgi:hypothetical protein